MKKTKILFVIGTLNLDGASTWQLTLAKYIDQSKFECEIVALIGVKDFKRIHERISNQPNKVISLDFAEHKLNPFDYPKLLSVAKELRPDIIVNSNIHTAFLTRVVAKIVNAKHVTVYQNVYSSLKWFVKLPELITRNWCDHKVCVSRAVYNTLPNVPKAEKSVIYNSGEINESNTDLNLLREKYGLTSARNVFVNIARYHPQKNQINFVKAFAQHAKNNPNDKLLIVGWGELEDELRTLVLKLDASKNIFITGPVDDVSGFLQISTHFALPSNHEGLPLALVEAISVGKPLLVTDLPELVDIANKSNSVLIEGTDSANILKGIEAICSLKEKETLKMSENSSKIFQQRFSPKVMTEQYSNLFKSL